MLVLLTLYILAVLIHEQYPQVVNLAMVFTWILCFLMFICIILFGSALVVSKSENADASIKAKQSLSTIQQDIKQNSNTVFKWLVPTIIIASLTWMGLVVTLFVYAFFALLLHLIIQVIKGEEYV